jgi:curved DNA-binding protein CbpA
VRKAYRDAVLRFHPDRQREATLAQRVRAEEAFKLITSKMEAYHG